MSLFSRGPTLRRRDDPRGGLPGALPPGECVLWQGAPDVKILALRVLHVRKVAIYLGLMLAWFAVQDFSVSHWERTLAGLLCLTLMALLAIGALLGFAWLLARTTTYTLTDQRIVFRCGIALTMSINLPLRLVENADVRGRKDGSGDIALAMIGRQKLGYGVLWPHVRPWRFNSPQPMMRALPDVGQVARLLAGALAETAILPSATVEATPVREAVAA